MPILENQLKIWAQAPSKTEMQKIQHTRQIIEDALKNYLPIEQIKRIYNLSEFKYEVYLQGSYANSTNIKYNSDVDIVVQLDSIFSSDKSQLTEEEKQLHKILYSNSTYKFVQFKKDVFNALHKAFNNDVEYSKKCIKVKENTNRVNADVVPAFLYKIYKRFISHDNQTYISGMQFFNTDDMSLIINFPKIHIENCKSKNIDTERKFKDMIRIFKNMKSNLVEKSILNDKSCPSYYIENLIYNCSSSCFDGSYGDCVLKTLQFLFDASESGRISGFICANEQDSLFSPKTWNLIDARNFIIKIGDYYLHPEKYED